MIDTSNVTLELGHDEIAHLEREFSARFSPVLSWLPASVSAESLDAGQRSLRDRGADDGLTEALRALAEAHRDAPRWVIRRSFDVVLTAVSVLVPGNGWLMEAAPSSGGTSFGLVAADDPIELLLNRLAPVGMLTTGNAWVGDFRDVQRALGGTAMPFADGPLVEAVETGRWTVLDLVARDGGTEQVAWLDGGEHGLWFVEGSIDVADEGEQREVRSVDTAEVRRLLSVLLGIR